MDANRKWLLYKSCPGRKNEYSVNIYNTESAWLAGIAYYNIGGAHVVLETCVTTLEGRAQAIDAIIVRRV
jgi:hypothetical protein